MKLQYPAGAGLEEFRNTSVGDPCSYSGGCVVEDGVVGVVPGAPIGGRWVFEFPFVLPVVPVVEGLVVSG